jgi:hypothetical protein
MRSRNRSIIPTVDTVDRSSTGIKNPLLVSVDGDDSESDVEDTLDALHQSGSPLQSSNLFPTSLDVAAPLKMEGGSSMKMSSGEPTTPVTPDLNWLVALGEG